jgi:outer membrane lipopolysaccharide assembly protein LptE/RlpB
MQGSRFKTIACVAVLIALMLQGCGFHVRTADLDSLGFSEVSLSCDKSSSWDLCQELERELASHKVTLKEDALFELRVFSIEAKERVFTINQDATADEYELTRSLKFSLEESASDESKYTNEISARRIYRHSSSELLAKDREQAAITKALDQSLAQEIIRQLTLIRIGN